jgi:hypothetical protein
MKKFISKKEMEKYWNAQYKIRAVVPSASEPYVKEFKTFQEELKEYLRNYEENDEFLISIQASEEKAETAKDRTGRKIKLIRSNFKNDAPFEDLLKQLGIKPEKLKEVEEFELNIFEGIYSYPFLKTLIKKKLGKKSELVISRVVARII